MTETIRNIPLQRTFIPFRTHNNLGVRQIDLLLAAETYDTEIFEITGNADLEILNVSDVAGTVYVHFGVNPVRVAAEVVANAWGFYPYIALDREQTYRAPCRTRYAKVVYVNGAADQTEWDFSVQLRPIGRS